MTRILLFILLSLSCACSHSVKRIGGTTSVYMLRRGEATKKGAIAQIGETFYLAKGEKAPSPEDQCFPKESDSRWIEEGIAKGLGCAASEVGVGPFLGDTEVGFVKSIGSEECAHVTFYIDNVGLLKNNENADMFRVTVAYQALVEMQGERSSSEALETLSELTNDAMRMAIVRTLRRDGWVLAEPELAREKERKGPFVFGPDPEPTSAATPPRGPEEERSEIGRE